VTDEEYGHDADGSDPRGPDFDPPNTPAREQRMAARAYESHLAPADPEQVCPICGQVHKPESA
jgi:hypothetical protein